MIRSRRGLGASASLSNGPQRPLLPNLARSPFTAAQKRSLDLRAQAVNNTSPYINPDLSFYNPPADSTPLTVTPQNGAPGYPGVGLGAITVITYVVASGLMVVIRELSIVHIGGNAPDFTGRVIWRVVKNGAGIRGLNSLNAQYGTFAAPKSLVLTGVENDIFTVTVECPALLPNGVTPNPGMAAGQATAASFDGWTYPIAEAQSRG
jgi:hypothetical protein